MRGPGKPRGDHALIGALALLFAAGCASSGAAGPSSYPAQPEPPSGEVYAYPTRGQSAQRQDRDRYECHEWSVRQTRFDPSVGTPRAVSAAPPVRVVPVPPPGTSLLAGAVTGALIGAAVSNWHNQAGGAAWGAAAGALLGGIADAARVQQARQIEAGYASQSRGVTSGYDSRASGYRRALSACLLGRGYTVQ